MATTPSPIVVTLRADAASFTALHDELQTVKAAIGESLERAAKARDFFFGDGEHFAPSLVEIRSVPAVGTRDVTIRLEVTGKFRAFTAALAAGEFDGKVVDPVHGGSCGG